MPLTFIGSTSYMCAIGVVGMVLVVIGSTLEALAANVGKTTTEIGSVFLSRGVGSMLGAISCSKLYHWYNGNDVLTGALVVVSMVLLILPFSIYVSELHIFFFILGAGTAITDTGCQLMTRRMHGSHAGPWLGANAAVFGLSAASVPLLEMISSQTITRYVCFAVIALMAASLTFYVSTLERMSNQRQRLLLQPRLKSYESITANKSTNHGDNLRWTEVCIALMLFCFVGGGVTATAYIISYVDETNILPKPYKATIFLVLWVFITIGRLLGIYMQRSLSLYQVQLIMTGLCIGGFLSMTLVFVHPTDPIALWIGTALYGLFHGPTVGFSQDLNNRLTPVCEKSMAMVMLGLVCGASLMPYVNATLWRSSGFGPQTLIVIMGVSSLLPLPLLYLAKHFTTLDLEKQEQISVIYAMGKLDSSLGTGITSTGGPSLGMHDDHNSIDSILGDFKNSRISNTTDPHYHEHMRLESVGSYDSVPVVDFVEIEVVVG